MFCNAELASVEQKTTILLQTQITSEELSVEAKVGFAVHFLDLIPCLTCLTSLLLSLLARHHCAVISVTCFDWYIWTLEHWGRWLCQDLAHLLLASLSMQQPATPAALWTVRSALHIT